MSPSRANSSRRNLSASFRPYTRGVAPNLIPSPSSAVTPNGKRAYLVPSAPSSVTPGPGSPVLARTQRAPVERPGFPTYAQYKQVEAAYLHSLTPRRQGKALISQALFDRIWDVLHLPESPGETAQFRFWARKMFTLSKTHCSTFADENSQEDSQEVLLHDNLLVAIQEQLYDLLCYCHGSTGHGGRDKTCALIRKHYTWVPKDLVSNFIKACPTCIMKKCGSMDSATLASRMAGHRTDDASVVLDSFWPESPSPSAAAAHVANSPVAVPWPRMSGNGDVSTPSKLDETDPIEVAYREAVQRARGIKASLSGFGNHSSSLRDLNGVPMLREVSLYKGLPNGWQYRHNDYASAHAEFMDANGHSVVQDGDLGVHVQRPRVPSILPFWSPNQFAQGDSSESPQEADLGIASDGFSFGSPVNIQGHQAHEISSRPHALMAHAEQTAEKEVREESEPRQTFVEHINPILADSTDEHQTPVKPDRPSAQAEVGSTPTSLKRLAIPPRLQIDLTGSRSFQSFVAYGDSLTGESISPDSPFFGMNWHGRNDLTPTSSDESSCTSSFMMPPMSAATTITPPGSVLTTPVDEFTTKPGGSPSHSPDGDRENQRWKSSMSQHC